MDCLIVELILGYKRPVNQDPLARDAENSRCVKG